jgi:regulatory associated protein of mTOR
LRRQIRSDRLLIHYNGHGVPRPTKNGELWVFGKHYTHYMPIALNELRGWIGGPSIYVFDCSGAGALLPHCIVTPPGSPSFHSEYDTDRGESDPTNFGKGFTSPKPRKLQTESSAQYTESTSTCFVLAACKSDESLPLNSLYPADIFTACLTTPIPIALRWFILQVSSPFFVLFLNLPSESSPRP